MQPARFRKHTGFVAICAGCAALTTVTPALGAPILAASMSGVAPYALMLGAAGFGLMGSMMALRWRREAEAARADASERVGAMRAALDEFETLLSGMPEVTIIWRDTGIEPAVLGPISSLLPGENRAHAVLEFRSWLEDDAARSRRRISGAAWRRAIAKFTRQIRRSLRRTEIAHNVIWFAPGAKGKWGRMQTRSANVITLERGVNDAGLTGGDGQFSLRNFLRFSRLGPPPQGQRPVATRTPTPSRGATTAWPATSWSTPAATSSRVRAPATRPTGGRGYQVRLGAPRGKRYRWRGFLRRDFQRGMVLMNEPGSPDPQRRRCRARLTTADRQYRVSTVAARPRRRRRARRSPLAQASRDGPPG